MDDQYFFPTLRQLSHVLANGVQVYAAGAADLDYKHIFS
jgi:hypothetical protein